jgi:hypothetical protein
VVSVGFHCPTYIEKELEEISEWAKNEPFVGQLQLGYQTNPL